jgi:DNA-binding XRE family transcriptional regulator
MKTILPTQILTDAHGKPRQAVIDFNLFSQVRDFLEKLEEKNDFCEARKIKEHSSAEDYLPLELSRSFRDENPFKAAREYYGYTQKQLAEKTGLKQEYISQIECGKRRPKKETAKKISDVFGLSVSFFT